MNIFIPMENVFAVVFLKIQLNPTQRKNNPNRKKYMYITIPKTSRLMVRKQGKLKETDRKNFNCQ